MKTHKVVVSLWLVGMLGLSGTALGNDFRISTSANISVDADVSHNPQSNEFFTVWSETSGMSYDIVAQRVATDGTLVGGNILVTPTTNGRFPAVASKTGQSLVVWLSGGDDKIEGQRVDSAGTLVGSAFAIETSMWSSHRWPDVAYSSGDDEYLVVWADGSNWDIFGRLVDPNGNVGARITICTATNNQQRPKVAYNSTDGEFLVVWDDGRNATGPVHDIYGQRIRSDGALGGTLVGGNVAISTAAAHETHPALAYNVAGNGYEVVWKSTVSGGQIVGQRLNSAVAPAGSSVLIAPVYYTIASLDVTYGSANQEFKVVWADGTNSYSTDIYGQWLNGDGSLNGGNFVICAAGWGQEEPAIAYGSQDNAFLTVWDDARLAAGVPHIYGEIEEGPDYQHKMHYAQLPDTNGWDVLCTRPETLADDFRCASNGVITEIRFWGSWENDEVGVITNVYLSIHADWPATNSPTGYSMPSNLLWSANVPGSQVIVRGPFSGDQGWFEPPDTWNSPDHQTFYEYVVQIHPDNAFTQRVDDIYWLDIQVDVEEAGTVWGWKTSTNHWNDDAVYWDDNFPFHWRELIDPETSESLDLAFVINGQSIEEEEVEHKMHWPQFPDPYGWDVRACGGLDGLRKVLADDFLCTANGYITQIIFWGSWSNDFYLVQDPNQGIQDIHLSFHADIPDPDEEGPEYSKPDLPALWEMNVNPNVLPPGWVFSVTNEPASEQGWYDPNTGVALQANHNNYFRYEITIPTDEAFFQIESNIYWLDISVQALEGMWGWKTSTNNWNDDAVWADLPVFDTNQWQELRDPFFPTNSLDLAFIINGEPVPDVIITNIVVTNIVGGTQGILLQWNAVAGVSYQVQEAATLTNLPVVWINVPPPIIGPAYEKYLIRTNTLFERYYRIRVP